MTRPGLEIHAGAVRQRLSPSAAESCRVLLVGEINPYGAEPEFALYCAPESSAGGRLQRLVLDLPRADYLAVWRGNLCVGGWDKTDANARAAALLAGHHPWAVVVALGAKVSTAFWAVSGSSESRWRLWEVHRAHDRTVICLPHPSGRNADVWGRGGAFERARGFVMDAAPELWA